MVAYRLATIRHADQILVFDQGRLVEHGTHDTLAGAQSTYARLWRTLSGPTIGSWARPTQEGRADGRAATDFPEGDLGQLMRTAGSQRVALGAALPCSPEPPSCKRVRWPSCLHFLLPFLSVNP